MNTRQSAPAPIADDPPTGRLSTGTLVAAALAVCVGQVALAIPAVLNGLFQKDLGTTASQLTWISDAFLVPVTLLELTFGVLGDLFGRKRLLIVGAAIDRGGRARLGARPPARRPPRARACSCSGSARSCPGIGAAALFPDLAGADRGGHAQRPRAGRTISI